MEHKVALAIQNDGTTIGIVCTCGFKTRAYKDDDMVNHIKEKNQENQKLLKLGEEVKRGNKNV